MQKKLLENMFKAFQAIAILAKDKIN
jgi:hypothetical protein